MNQSLFERLCTIEHLHSAWEDVKAKKGNYIPVYPNFSLAFVYLYYKKPYGYSHREENSFYDEY